MKILFLVLLLLPTTVFPAQEEEPTMQSQNGEYEISDRTHRLANRFDVDVKNGRAEVRVHKGLDTLIRIAAYKLKRVGKKAESRKLLKEWNEQYSAEYLGYLRGERHIGDHPPISQWLQDKMEALTFILGMQVMENLRLSDIETFNSTPKVIFGCVDNVDEDEYGLHWIDDPTVDIRGLAPTAVFWISEAACLGASLSSGFIFCAPICMGVEYLTKLYIAPKTNNWCWKKACHK